MVQEVVLVVQEAVLVVQEAVLVAAVTVVQLQAKVIAMEETANVVIMQTSKDLAKSTFTLVPKLAMVTEGTAMVDITIIDISLRCHCRKPALIPLANSVQQTIIL